MHMLIVELILKRTSDDIFQRFFFVLLNISIVFLDYFVFQDLD